MSEYNRKFKVGDKVVFSEHAFDDSNDGYWGEYNIQNWSKRGVDVHGYFVITKVDDYSNYPYDIQLVADDKWGTIAFMEKELEFAKGQMKLPFKGV